MSKDFAPRVLLVDDEPLLLKALTAVLELNGFVCRTAGDGFEALRRLRETPPDIIISDLRMPNMSGFELLAIIRRRFPQIAVIVTSGEFLIDVPTSGLLMNAFFQKGEYTPEQLIATMHELYSECPIRPALPKQEHAPIWINRRSNEYLLATCTECLRSFPIETEHSPVEGVQTAECSSCGTTISYVVDSNVLKMLESYRDSRSNMVIRPQPSEAVDDAPEWRVEESSHTPRNIEVRNKKRKTKNKKTIKPKVLVAEDSDLLLPADVILGKPVAVPKLVPIIHGRLEKRGMPDATNIERVAAILERDSSATINDWLLRVECEDELTCVPLSDEQRTGHLPKLLEELVLRLRVPRKLGTKAVSKAAVQHGKDRRSQGYTVPMIIEESRILQVSIFETLEKSLRTVNFSLLLIDVMAIADECDSQLKQTIISFTGQEAA